MLDRESDEEKDPEAARAGALAHLMAKRSGTAGKASRRAASAGPAVRESADDDESGGEAGWEGVKDSKRQVGTVASLLAAVFQV